MRRHWRLLTVLGLLLLGASLLHPVIYWPLLGWFRGEQFHNERPTSYWKQEIESAYVEIELADGRPSSSVWVRIPSPMEEWLAYLPGGRPRVALEPEDHINPAGLPVFVALLSDESVPVRRFAAHALRQLGTQARPATPALMRATEDEDETVRRDVRVALDRLASPAPGGHR